MSQTQKTAGTVHHVGEVEHISATFSKRILVLRIDGMHPQEVKFDAFNARVNLLEGLKLHDEVEVVYELMGKRSDYQGKMNWFNTLGIHEIKVL